MGTHISKAIGLLGVWAILLSGCVTTPEGNKEVDIQRVAAVAKTATYFGAALDLSQNPNNRPAYAMAVEMLKSLEATGVDDPGAFAKAMAGLNVRKFTGPEGVLYIQAAVMVWDQALLTLAPVTQKELVQLVLPQVRLALEMALAATAPAPP